jgi:hypothetical protein
LPDKSHYLLLNSGVDAKRPPRPGTIFPNDFIVEYVRVYARPDVPALLNRGFENEDAAPWPRWNEAAVVDYVGITKKGYSFREEELFYDRPRIRS